MIRLEGDVNRMDPSDVFVILIVIGVVLVGSVFAIVVLDEGYDTTSQYEEEKLSLKDFSCSQLLDVYIDYDSVYLPKTQKTAGIIYNIQCLGDEA